MDTTNSFLKTVLERIRGYLDADETEKYGDSWTTRNIIGPSMVDVMARLNMSADNPVLLRYSMTLVPGQQYYQLPCSIAEVWKVAIIDTTGHVISEELPRGIHNPRGFNWSIEGNLLSIMPYPGVANTFDLWYTSNGDYSPHYSTGGGTLNSALTIFTLGTPTVGVLDRRPGAYAGQILRLLPVAPGAVEERVITSHDPVAGTVTVRVPFSYLQYKGAWANATPYVVNDIVTKSSIQYVCIAAHTSLTTTREPPNATYWRVNTAYEIAPLGSEALYDSIAIRGAMKLGVCRNISETKKKSLLMEYGSAMKTIGDNLSNLQSRTGKSFDRGSDNIARYRM